MTSARLSRIRNLDAYRESQPDLDVFKPCFKGFASPRFTGTDLDGIFVASWAGHGLWERDGYVLVQEHKSCPASLAMSWGQWLALNALADIPSSRRLAVIVTFGHPDLPSEWLRLPVSDWRKYRSREDFEGLPLEAIDPYDLETWPHRRWIRLVAKRMGR